MEVPNEEGEMPIPLNSSFGHGHMMHHPTTIISYPPGPDEDHHLPSSKKSVRYRECLKNHAAGMGGNATDGCGEFMASGEEGTLEALTCSACSCHRNFHRKEVEGVIDLPAGRKLFHHHHHHKGYAEHHLCHHAGAIRAPMIMSYSMGASDQSDDQDGAARAPPHQKKRFRTKFTAEQKEKMLEFAERVGWKIQKQEEGVVQQFCQEVGVKRRVLKVWMHNNKHTLAKKNIHSDPPNQL